MAGDARSRRNFLAAGLATITCAAIWPADAKTRIADRRHLELHNLHTGEKINAVYWANGRYDPGVLHQVNHVLRDFRDGEIHAIDPKLLDLLAHLRARLNTSAPYEVVSGYRSPETNAMLAAMSDGVAAGSLHMVGKAIDMRLTGRSLRQVHRVALGM